MMRAYEQETGNYWLPIEVKEQVLFAKGWQASRAAMVVELPERCQPVGHDYVLSQYDATVAREEGHDEALDECRAAVIAAGGTVAA